MSEPAPEQPIACLAMMELFAAAFNSYINMRYPLLPEPQKKILIWGMWTEANGGQSPGLDDLIPKAKGAELIAWGMRFLLSHHAPPDGRNMN